MTIVPCIFLIIISIQSKSNHEVKLAFWVGLGVLIMYIAYFTLLARLFWSAIRSSTGNNLFRIWTQSGRGMYLTVLYISFFSLFVPTA